MNLFSKPKGKHTQGSNAQGEGASSRAEAGSPVSDEEVPATESVKSQGAGDGAANADEDGGQAVDAGGEGDAEGGEPNREADGAPTDDDQPDSGEDDAKDPDSDPDADAAQGDPRLDGVRAIAPIEADGGGFVAAGFGEIPSEKRRRGLKVLGITVGVLAAVLLVAYLVGAVVFMGRFLPNTKIGDRDISLKTDAEVAELLDGIVADYQLDVIGGGFAYRTTGDGIGLAIDSAGIIQAMHGDESPWEWPKLIIQPNHDETSRLHIDFKPSVYEDDVRAAIAKFNEGARPPVNATIVYDEKNDKFIVKPEEMGTQLDAQLVIDDMAQAIDTLDTKLVLGDAHLLKPAVLSTDEKLIEAAELATGMVSADLSLILGGQPIDEVTGEKLSQFITIDENFAVVFREEEMNAWVDNLAAGYNTVGTERSYTRADGKQVVVPPEGSYGWEIDTEALKNAVLEGIKAGSTQKIEVPCIETAAMYNGAGQRDWGNRYIDVDITEQHVRFYGDDGSIIWEDDCISGMPDGSHDTVAGTWYVNNKESPSKLIGYEHGKKIYETTVTYWMPFEGNGIGFHDATWQPSFGGSMYANGYGSHGCVNLSYNAAQSLYDIIQIGDVVVVHF